MSITALRKALAEADMAFAGHPDVVLVGIGEKYAQGVCTKREAIIVFVRRKGQPEGPLVPDRIDLSSGAFPTDVREMAPEALTLTNRQLDGSDFLVATDSDRSGTLGFVSIEDSQRQRVFGITNAHVVGPPDTDSSGAPIWGRRDGRWIEIGTVHRHTVLRSDGRQNPPDVALIALNQDGIAFARAYQVEAWPGDQIRDIDGLSPSPFAGARLEHAYATKADGGMRVLSAGPIFEVSPRPMLDTDPKTGARKMIRFRRVFVAPASGAVRQGHSGAVLTRKRASDNARVASGLVVGGSGRSLFAFSFPDVYGHIRDSFGITL